MPAALEILGLLIGVLGALVLTVPGVFIWVFKKMTPCFNRDQQGKLDNPVEVEMK